MYQDPGDVGNGRRRQLIGDDNEHVREVVAMLADLDETLCRLLRSGAPSSRADRSTVAHTPHYVFADAHQIEADDRPGAPMRPAQPVGT